MTGYLPSYMLCIYDLEIKRWHIMHISIFIVNILSKRTARKPDSGFLLNQLKNDWLLFQFQKVLVTSWYIFTWSLYLPDRVQESG